MGEITEIAMTLLRQAERRTEIAGQNLANAATPGFKRHLAFAQAVGAVDRLATPGVSQLVETQDRSGGKLFATGSAGDLSVEGAGWLAVRDGDRLAFIRSGSFHRADDGTLRDGQQRALQAADGSDLVLNSGSWSLRADGVVLQAGREVGRIGVFAGEDAGESAVARDDVRLEAGAGSVRQGMLEASNVSTGDEMVAMMEALRRAESGQRVLQIYDALMDRVIQVEGGVS